MTPSRVLLVCGGRTFDDPDLVVAALDFLVPFYAIDGIMQGGTQGAETAAKDWAARNGIKAATIKADWRKHGRQAAAKRNQKMLDLGRPILLLAWPGGAATRDLIRRAEAAGVAVIRPHITMRVNHDGKEIGNDEREGCGGGSKDFGRPERVEGCEVGGGQRVDAGACEKEVKTSPSDHAG